MDNQEFKAIWQASDKKNLVKFEPEKLSIEIISKLDQSNKKAKRNAYTEIVVAILMIPFFTYLAIEIPFVLSKIGAVIIVLSMLLIVYKMIKSLKKEKENLDLPIQEYLSSKKQHLLEQTKLIDTVLYWYILPPGIGVLLFIIGFETTNFSIFFSLAISVFVYAFIYFLNKRAVKKHFKPLLKELETQIEEFKEI